MPGRLSPLQEGSTPLFPSSRWKPVEVPFEGGKSLPAYFVKSITPNHGELAHGRLF